MGLILDTSVLVAARRRRFDLAAALEAYGDLEVGIAAITAAELVRGVSAGREPAAARRLYVDRILEDVPVVPFGLAEAREYGRIWADLRPRQSSVDPHSLMVAATALTLDWALMTLDPARFEGIDGLVIAPTPHLRLTISSFPAQ
jgi:tRNA(fMet)-specific endonuclease VapC